MERGKGQPRGLGGMTLRRPPRPMRLLENLHSHNGSDRHAGPGSLPEQEMKSFTFVHFPG